MDLAADCWIASAICSKCRASYVYIDIDQDTVEKVDSDGSDAALQPEHVLHLPLQPVTGYRRKQLDQILEWMPRDVLYSVPFIFFVILLIQVFGSNIWLIFVAIGAVEWLTMARIVRGQTISLRQKEFVEAAKAGGASGPAIVLRHIVPNLMGPVVVFATLNVARVILLESFLSFLGLGVQEPLTSLGKLIADGANNMDTAPWMIIYPAAVMFVTLLCLNFVGDGLRDALDPKDR